MRSVLAAFLSAVVVTTGAAQVSTNYQFSQTVGSYAPIVGTSIAGVAADWVNVSNDDNLSVLQPIGFTFTYRGVPYTQFRACTNGWLALGATTVTSNYTAIAAASPNDVVAVFNRDLQSNVAFASIDVRYETSGSAPNRVLTVQWTNFRKFNQTGDNYNFQCKLHEDGDVEIVYGTMTNGTVTGSAQVGLRGASSADFNCRSIGVGGSWAASATGLVNTASCAFSNVQMPASGTTFYWDNAPAVAPANDECANAAALSVGTNFGTTAAATVSADPTVGCAAFNAFVLDTWHVFTATENCLASVARTGAGATSLALYQGTCGAFTLLGCSTTATPIPATFVAGTTYYVRVGQFGTLANVYGLELQCVPIPANDDCLNAAVAGLGANLGTTAGASHSAQVAAACTGLNGPTIADVWYAFSAPNAGTYRFSVTGASQLGISTFDCASPTVDLACASGSALTMTAGETVLVRVGNATAAAHTLNILEVPANDTLAGAFAVSVGINPSAPAGVDGLTYTNVGTNTALDTNGGTIPAPSCRSTGMTNDVYFVWTSVCDGPVTVSLCPPAGFAPGTHLDTVLQVLDGSTTTQVACNDDFCAPQPGADAFASQATFAASAGATYYFRVGSWDSLTADGSFYLSVLPQAEQTVAGVGCGVVPASLAGAAAPELGQPNALTVTAEAFSNGIMFFSGVGAAPLPLGFGCTLYVDSANLFFLGPVNTDGAGVWTLPYAAPNDPAFVCVELMLQALVVGPSGAAWTNGLELKIGY
jgi:hypothetical protein